MTRLMHPLILRCGVTFLLVLPVQLAAAKDRDKNKDRGGVRQLNPQPGQNLPKFGGNSTGSGGGNLGGNNSTPRKMEIHRGQNPLGNSGSNTQGPAGGRIQNNFGGGGGVIQNNPNLGGGQPVLKRRDGDNKPGGGVINNPNLGGNAPNLGGGQPVLKRKDNQPSGGGVINNPNLSGGQPVLKRRDGDNKPGGGIIKNPNLGGNAPNLGGGQPVLKRKDNQPSGGGVINNPNLGGGQPVLKRRDGDNKPGGGIINNPNLGGTINPGNTGSRINNKNPELKNHLKQFQPNLTKRQDNERQLLRNKDQVQQLLNNNPTLKNKIQQPDGKLDLSRLHLELGAKDRIPASIHKNGMLPIKLENHDDLRQQFDKMGHAKNLDDLGHHFKQFQDPTFLKQHPEFAHLNIQHASGHFQQNIVNVNNNYNNLVVSNVGQQLHLQQQYNLYQHGDVARQMSLNVALINGGGWQNRYVGPVYNNYTKACFSSWYCGPGYYPNYCWTPTWSPWVDWCWWNTCLPIYDPRPLYCRPYIYNPCPVWTVYPYPVWQPLPVYAACGTWVDYTPILVDNVDLQLVAVRFVDNGHPDQELGSRYRIWLQNNSRVGIAGNFNVLLLASNTPDASADLPQAGITIPSMEAGEMKVVDVRLPFAASKMNRVDNHLTPFSFLHVLVDSHRQLDDVNLANNGAVIPRADILPVDPAAFAPDVSAAAPGAIVSVAGEGFGPEPGRLIVSVNGVQSEATIFGWYDLGVQFELPNVAVNGPTDAEVLVVRGDGAASNPVTVRLAPENRLQEATLPPAPLP